MCKGHLEGPQPAEINIIIFLLHTGNNTAFNTNILYKENNFKFSSYLFLLLYQISEPIITKNNQHLPRYCNTI